MEIRPPHSVVCHLFFSEFDLHQKKKKMKQCTEAPSDYPLRKMPADGSYDPVFYEAPVLHGSPKPEWADEWQLDAKTRAQRITYSFDPAGTCLKDSPCHVDAFNGLYLNPRGRTGITGRGKLGKFGPNHAADVIVTCTIDDEHFALMVEKHLSDSATLAWPAGMIEAGQTVPDALRAELTQEAVRESNAVDKLFAECDCGLVYRGWVDDFRNTDNAWMETTVHHFHATDEIRRDLQLHVTDTEEIKAVRWHKMEEVTRMYASHMDWLHIVLMKLNLQTSNKKRKNDSHSYVS